MKQIPLHNNHLIRMKSKVIKIKKCSNINDENGLNISPNKNLNIRFQQSQLKHINTPPIFLNVKSDDELSKNEQSPKTNEIYIKKVSKNSNISKGSLNLTNKKTLCESPNPRNSISNKFKYFHNRNINSKCDVNSFDIPTDTNNSISSSNSNFLNYNLGITNSSIEGPISMDLNDLKDNNSEEEIIFEFREHTYRDELRKKKSFRNKSKLNFENTEEYKVNETKNAVNKSIYKIKNF